MDLQRLNEETSQVTVEFAGESAVVEYRRNAFTLGLSRAFAAARDKQDNEALAAALEKLIAGWDLTLNGAPIPVDVEGICLVPIPLLSAIEDAIGDDLVPSSEEGNASSDTSSTPSSDFSAAAAIPPNGQPTSPSPNDSESQSPTLSEPVSTG